MRLRFIVLLTVALIGCDARDTSQPSASLAEPVSPEATATVGVNNSEFAWFTGCWQTEDGAYREEWSQDFGGLLFGFALEYGEARAITFMEQTRLIFRDDWYYEVSVDGAPSVAFKRVKQEDGFVQFENPENDYPQKILYRKTETGMMATIMAAGDNEGDGFGFVFVPCNA